MGIMVYSFVGNAGFASATVLKVPKPLVPGTCLCRPNLAERKEWQAGTKP